MVPAETNVTSLSLSVLLWNEPSPQSGGGGGDAGGGGGDAGGGDGGSGATKPTHSVQPAQLV